MYAVMGEHDLVFTVDFPNAEKAMAAFGLTVREEVDLQNLTAALLEVVEETLQPETVAVWLKEK